MNATATVRELLTQSNEIADEQHAYVIREAFANASIVCPHCSFPINAEMWINDLAGYVYAKIMFHRWNIRTERRINRLWTDHEYGVCSKEERDLATDGFHMMRKQRVREIKQLRASLDIAYPCLQCRKLYNPTAIRKICRASTLPQRKDIFDE